MFILSLYSNSFSTNLMTFHELPLNFLTLLHVLCQNPLYTWYKLQFAKSILTSQYALFLL